MLPSVHQVTNRNGSLFFFFLFKILFTFFFFFFWSIVDLQWCVNFRCIAQWLFFRIFSLIDIKRYWVEFPLLYSRALLVYIYNCVYVFCFVSFQPRQHRILHLQPHSGNSSSMYMLISNSYFIPSPPLSPLVTTSLFSLSVSLISEHSFFFFLRAAPGACGGSQARDRIAAVAAGLHHSHGHSRSELHLQPTPQLTAMLDP